MIEEKNIKELILSKIEGTDLFLVNIIIGSSNEIKVLLDSKEGVRIEQCVELSRWLTGELDLLEDNYSLEVSSPGLGEPLLVKEQFEKNEGKEVEVLFEDGKKKKGKLLAYDGETIKLEVKEKMIAEGGSQKKKKHVDVERTFEMSSVKSTKIVITF